MTLFLIFLGLSLGTPTPVLAQNLPPVVYSTTTAPDIIAAYAIHYGIPAGPLVATLRCESRFYSNAVGDNGSSFGVAQIHLPAHLDVSKAQALDPLWSIDWAAREFAQGRAYQWTCYRKLYG